MLVHSCALAFHDASLYIPRRDWNKKKIPHSKPMSGIESSESLMRVLDADGSVKPARWRELPFHYVALFVCVCVCVCGCVCVFPSVSCRVLILEVVLGYRRHSSSPVRSRKCQWRRETPVAAASAAAAAAAAPASARLRRGGLSRRRRFSGSASPSCQTSALAFFFSPESAGSTRHHGVAMALDTRN